MKKPYIDQPEPRFCVCCCGVWTALWIIVILSIISFFVSFGGVGSKVPWAPAVGFGNLLIDILLVIGLVQRVPFLFYIWAGFKSVALILVLAFCGIAIALGVKAINEMSPDDKTAGAIGLFIVVGFFFAEAVWVLFAVVAAIQCGKWLANGEGRSGIVHSGAPPPPAYASSSPYIA